MALTFPVDDPPPDGGGGPPAPPSPTPTPIPTPSPTPGPSPTPSPSAIIAAAGPIVTLALRSAVVPLSAVPAQVLAVTLAQQACTIRVYQKAFGIFLDLYVDGRAIVLGVQCEDRNRVVRDAYRGFTGDLLFVDTQGRDDPYYTGLGGRYVLLWVSS